MIISPPFLPAAGLRSGDQTETDPMMATVEQFELAHHGVYPIAFDRRWHCGTHLAPTEQTEPVRAIADGEVIAYRVSKNAISDGQLIPDTGLPMLNSNTGFVLLKHMTDTGDGRTITFYSLYMHLLDMTNQEQIAHQPSNPPENSSFTGLPKWLLYDTDGAVKPGNGRKVYRKDILGYFGRNHDYPHLHFEIFMTEVDFKAWFEQDGHKVQLGEKSPVQPVSKDYWGHTYFVISGELAQGQQTTFIRAPSLTSVPNAKAYFPAVGSGNLDKDSTLYVEAWFSKGQRYTRAWLGQKGSGQPPVLLTPQPVTDPYGDYEYNLYQRAMVLYKDCPSDGYELMRFGRILSDNPTLHIDKRATYVAMPFDDKGTLGYIDVNQSAILKLSDADFPFFTGWQKIDDASQALDRAGLWNYGAFRKLVGDEAASAYPVPEAAPEFRIGDELAAYLQGSGAVRDQLRGFVCHAPSEWDPVNNDQRYKGLNEPDGFFGSRVDTDPDGYSKFEAFLKKFQFLDQTPLSGGQKFWFFHPLAFIRHFRKCGWFNKEELAQCLPRKNTHLYHAAFVEQQVATWSNAAKRMERWRKGLNEMMRKYCISSSNQRILHFFSQVIEESGYLRLAVEGGAINASYAPYYGRGLIQLTHPGSYKKFGDFRRFATSNPSADAKWSAIRWNPDILMAKDDSHFNAENCADSAGFYWTCPDITATGENGLQVSDNGFSLQDVIHVSKLVNGNVAQENINGLDVRLQLSVFMRYVLLDIIPSGVTERISFVWRRNTSKELILDPNGQPALDSHHHPKYKFYPTTQNIDVFLIWQRP